MRRHSHTHTYTWIHTHKHDKCLHYTVVHLYRLNFSCRKSLAAVYTKPITQSHASLVASPSLAPPSIPFSLSQSLFPLCALPVSAYCCYCLQCAHVKSNKFNNAYGMKAKHTHAHSHLPGRMAYEVTHTPSGTQNSCQVERAGSVCLAGFFIVWGMPQDASATAAQRRRSRLITMQI